MKRIALIGNLLMILYLVLRLAFWYFLTDNPQWHSAVAIGFWDGLVLLLLAVTSVANLWNLLKLMKLETPKPPETTA